MAIVIGGISQSSFILIVSSTAGWAGSTNDARNSDGLEAWVELHSLALEKQAVSFEVPKRVAGRRSFSGYAYASKAGATSIYASILLVLVNHKSQGLAPSLEYRLRLHIRYCRII